MKDTSVAIRNTTHTSAKIIRRANPLRDVEPYTWTTIPSKGFDDRRFKSALKRAVNRDLAPQTLIDAIKERIRNTDEPR